nr:uncharacterized protein LOC126056460 [Helicoverpa armigera]
MSNDIVKRLGLRGRRETLRMSGAWSDNVLVCDSTIVNVSLISSDNKTHNVKVRCVNEFNVPHQKLSILDCSKYPHLFDLKDKLCCSDSKPEILIGQDNYHLLLPIKIKLGKLNEPSATLTPLGWCVHGTVRVPQASRPARGSTGSRGDETICAVDCEGVSASASSQEEILLREIHEEVRRSFAVDALGVCSKPPQNLDEVRAIAQLERSAELVDGRWVIGLPWKDESRIMPDSHPNALKRLKGIERKMNKDSGFAGRYRERVDYLFINNFARELREIGESSPTCIWYLSHFGVDNPNKEKLRLVFDAADKINGKCLNDYLLTGPDLLSSLYGIMLRFRENKIAVTGDIKDMFLRIKIREEDQHALRFLWRNSPTEEVKTYVMTSLIFGANCSPFVAQFIKNKNAMRYESSQPAAVNAVLHSHYMDDYIDSLPDEASAIRIVKEISDIHRAGGFEMRNWTSNSVEVLNSLPEDTLGTTAVSFKVGQQYEGDRTLGLLWYPAEDNLGFDVSFKKIPADIIKGNKRPTKRVMLKVIMSIFDVLGFLSPFTVQGKIMLQDTWQLNIGWDDFVPDIIFHKWQKWIDLLTEINKVRIPRCYHHSSGRAQEKDGASEPVRASETDKHRQVTTACPHSSLSSATAVPTQIAVNSYEFVAEPTSATKCAICFGNGGSRKFYLACYQEGNGRKNRSRCRLGTWF